MYYKPYIGNKDTFEKVLKESYLKIRNNPLDVEAYKMEAQRSYEVGDLLYSEYKQLRRKFWLLGIKRKANKERVEELKCLLQILNFHVRCLIVFRQDNEWRVNYD